MTILDKLMFYLFIIYPVIGYITITYYNVPPVYFSSIIVFLSFVKKFSIQRTIKFPSYIKFYAFFLVSVIFSKYLIYQTPIRLDSSLSSIILMLLPLMVFLIIENTTFSNNFIKNSRKLSTYFIYVAAAVSIIQYFIPLFFIYRERYTITVRDMYNAGFSRRIPSIFTWGDLMNSRYIAIGFVIIYGILVYEYRNKRLMSILLPILAGIVVLFSQIRAAMLTYMIATLMLVFNRISVKFITYMLIFIASFYFIIDILDFNFMFFVENRLLSESAFTRIDAFSAFFYAFPQNPLFGTGGVRTEALFKGYGHVARLHNAHLAIAYYYGIFAFIFHTLFLISLMKKNFITAKRANYWPPFVGMLCYIVASMTLPGAEFYEPGLIFMIVFNKYYFDRYLLRKRIEENDEIH